MHKPSICISTGTFHPEAGGPPTYLYHLGAELTRRGYPLMVITMGEPQPGLTYPYPILRISRRQPIPLRLLRFTHALLTLGKRFDLWYVNDYGFPAALANLVLRKPVVMKIVGDFAWEFSIRHQWIGQDERIDEFQGKEHRWPVQLLKQVQRFYCHQAQVIITPSHYLKRIISGWGVPEEKIRVIYNAVDAARYNASCTQAAAREQLGIMGRVVLTIARLTPWKGVDHLIDVLPHLTAEVGDVQLVVVGDGPERSNLQRRAAERGVSERVHFVGRVDQSAVPLYLRAADVFVLYSGYEGLPHVVLEAMAAGVPVVASAAGGNVEVIEDGMNGFLVPIGEREQLASRLLELLTRDDLRQRFAQASQQRIRQSFSWDNLLRETLDTFQTIPAGGV